MLTVTGTTLHATEKREEKRQKPLDLIRANVLMLGRLGINKYRLNTYSISTVDNAMEKNKTSRGDSE